MHAKIYNIFKMKLNSLKKRYKLLYMDITQVFFGKSIVPDAIYIEPTNICNANCIFCAYQFYGAKKNVMSMDVFKKALKESEELAIKKINLTPFAGEILVDKSILDKIKIINKYNFKVVSTYTNLLNLHKFDIDEFLNLGITDLHISTAPLERNLYRKIYRVNKYDHLLENLISLLGKYNKSKAKTINNICIEFRGNISLNECINLPDYKHYIAPLISTNNIKIAAMNTYDSWMGSISQDDLLEGMKIAKESGKKILPCNRLNNLQVLSNGDMRVCGCRFNNASSEDIFYVGNIKTMSISKAYNSDIVKNLKKSFFKGTPPEECQKCSWYNL